MPIWETEPVSRQPTLTLRPWRVMQLPDGDRHLLGYCVENGEGRVSSAIRSFDPERGVVETRTGRAYVLKGLPGSNLDAEYVWRAWLRVNELEKAKDVSAEVARVMADSSGQSSASDT
ncbi:hypothetical protein H0Z60_06395 [Ectothiorhodospiraceae bacterium WFHF3C12]|nr:hypothetical protein [Ectothiorhodospiraceae bacterium WFHF3C12]